jgi:cytochrome c biogenesis protein CcdA/glutaredoxin
LVDLRQLLTYFSFKNHPANQDKDKDDGQGCALDEGENETHPSLEFNLSLENKSHTNNSNMSDVSVQCFVFFYSSGCPHCRAVSDYIKKDLTAHANFVFEAYEVHSSDVSRRLLLGYQHFGWEGDQLVPTIFIGDEKDMEILVGESAIYDNLLTILERLSPHPTGCYDFARLAQEEELDLSISDVNWGVLTAAALVDSINPCAIAVLLILLGGLVMSAIPPDSQQQVVPSPDAASSDGHSDEERPPVESGILESNRDENEEKDHRHEAGSRNTSGQSRPSETNAGDRSDIEESQNSKPTDSDRVANSTEAKYYRRRAFLSGMSFIFSVYIAYYLLGFGIFSAISSTKVSGTILLVLGIFIIFLGIWNIKDFMCYERGYNVEIPRSWRPLLKRILGSVGSPLGAFAAGFLVCLFELPCTGGPYLFILGLLADRNTRTEAALLLLYYNFIFVLPLIIINCLVFLGISTLERVGKWKEKYIRHLHLFAGIVLIGLGVLAVVDSQDPIF